MMKFNENNLLLLLNMKNEIVDETNYFKINNIRDILLMNNTQNKSRLRISSERLYELIINNVKLDKGIKQIIINNLDFNSFNDIKFVDDILYICNIDDEDVFISLPIYNKYILIDTSVNISDYNKLIDTKFTRFYHFNLVYGDTYLNLKNSNFIIDEDIIDAIINSNTLTLIVNNLIKNNNVLYLYNKLKLEKISQSYFEKLCNKKDETDENENEDETDENENEDEEDDEDEYEYEYDLNYKINELSFVIIKMQNDINKLKYKLKHNI